MPPLGVDETTEAYIVERYRAGYTTRQIADDVHWSTSTVRKYLHLHGIRPERGRVTYHPRRCSADELRRTVELYRSGLSMEEVGAHLGLSSPSTVLQRLRAAGEPTRRPHVGVRLQAIRRPRYGPMRDAVLAHLSECREPALARDIAEALHANPSHVSQVLRALERRGFVHEAGVVYIGGRPRRTWARAGLRSIERAAAQLVQSARFTDPAPVGGKVPEVERLPIEPFRRWAFALLDRERHRRAVTGDEPDRFTVAQRLGLTDRRLYALLHEQDTIALATADRILLNAGDTFLWDLWPELYAHDGGGLAA